MTRDVTIPSLYYDGYGYDVLKEIPFNENP